MEFKLEFTLMEAFGFIIAILAIVLLVYIIMLVKKLLKTIDKVDVLLEDSKTITEVASRRTEQVDGMMDDVGAAVGIMVDAVKGNQNIAKAASSIVNGFASVVGVMKGKKKKLKIQKTKTNI